jgi:hypothetical protein
VTGGRPGWLAGFLVVALAALVSCSSGTSSTGSRLPARPSELRLDQVNPCALLTPAQVRQLGVHAGERGENTDEVGSVGCLWRNFPNEPDIKYVARLIVKRGADYALDSTEPTQVVTIDGFPAVQTKSPQGDPKDHCLLFVDVASGESLFVQWLTASRDYPGLTDQLACQQARNAGQLMLANLRELSH